MEKEKYLSKEETEQLCALYLECMLTRLEETELQYVLEILPYRSTLIDEVRTLMSIALTSEIERKSTPRSMMREHKKKAKCRIFLIAASITLLLSLGISTIIHYTRQEDCYCQVFTNGKQVSKDKALIIAEGELERIDRFFENMKTIESEQQKKMDSF